MDTANLLKMANADAHNHTIYGQAAIHELQMANELLRYENGKPESEWPPAVAPAIRGHVKAAYRLSGK